MKISSFATVLAIIFCFECNAQFLTTQGKKILDKDGQEIILKGMGLGGWMLQEGYMLQTNGFANPQHEIEAAVEDLIGAEKKAEFYEAWLSNHCTKTDIDSLASWGFNSVRLPMHYKLFTPPIEEEPVPGEITWIEKGFVMVDSVLSWCEQNEMYLILDLHAAPGGQGHDAAISDYDDTKPSLWESDENKAKTVALWRKLAERYSDEPWMGGYDLINETNWNFEGANENGCDESNNTPLKELYVDIVAAIREVDDNHVIFIEGNCWANNHAGIWPPWDDKLVISFHKYWNHNDQNAIQGFINMRNQHNIPVWMGESGENSNTWFKNAISLFEANDIGWCWWPMKKFGSVVNPMTIPVTDEYQTLLDYWSNGGTKPTEEFAYNALMGMAENLKIENNIYRKDVVDAMIRQVNDPTARPYKNHQIPGTINVTDFDLGGNGVAYYDTDTSNYHVSSGTYTAWNQGWAYRNDGVDIEASSDTDPKSNGFNVGWTADGEWMQYSTQVDNDGVYQLTVRYAAENQTVIRIETADKTLARITLPPTGGYQTWQSFTVDDLVLYQGEQKLRLFIENGGVNLSYLSFFLTGAISDVEFQLISAETNVPGDLVAINANKRFDESIALDASEFQLTLDGELVNIQSAAFSDTDLSVILLAINESYDDVAQLLLSYTGEGLLAHDGSEITAFSDYEVINNRPFHYRIPTQIEAENYMTNVGLVSEETTDEGGGLNMGYTNEGDYLEYRINVTTAGEYLLTARIACFVDPGEMNIQQIDHSGQVLNEVNVDVPVTGGWQVWQSVTTNMNLDEGAGVLRVNIVDPEFNLNWMDFKSTVTSSPNYKDETVKVFPNPSREGSVNFQIGTAVSGRLVVTDLTGKSIVEMDVESNTSIFSLQEPMNAGIYLWSFSNQHGEVYSGKFVIAE